MKSFHETRITATLWTRLILIEKYDSDKCFARLSIRMIRNTALIKRRRSLTKKKGSYMASSMAHLKFERRFIISNFQRSLFACWIIEALYFDIEISCYWCRPRIYFGSHVTKYFKRNSHVIQPSEGTELIKKTVTVAQDNFNEGNFLLTYLDIENSTRWNVF